VDAEDGQTAYHYDGVDNLTKRIDGNGHTTHYEYDALNRLIKQTNPEGHAVTLAYDAVGNLTSLTSARQNKTQFVYDGLYRLVKRTDALNGVWHYQYDAVGNLLTQIDANGHANNKYQYDNVYRLIRQTDAEGYRTGYQYDATNNLISRTDGNGHTEQYEYDGLDRLISLTNGEAETTRYQYDPLGNETAMIAADGIVTRYEYDPLYRLVAVIENQNEVGEGTDVNVATSYGYDAVGNLLTITDAEGQVTRFTYDGLNRLVQEVNALGKQWDYGYDAVGNRTARVDGNRQRTTYQYYPDDMLQQVTYHDGSTVAYQYDESNNRTVMVDHLGTTKWQYDALNRLTSQTDPYQRQLGYGYDAVGNRISLTYPDGNTAQYGYVDNNWLVSLTDPAGNVTRYERDGIGQMVKTINPNITITEASYDQADRLLTINSYQVGGAAKTNSRFSYTYDEVGQRVMMAAEYGWRKPNLVTSHYSYDGLRRLVRDEDSEGVWTTYSFNRVGNRLRMQTNDDSQSSRPFDEQNLSYSYNQVNQLLTVVGDTHPGIKGQNQNEQIAQALHAFEHEVSAQRGKHITTEAADSLLAMVSDLLSQLYDGQGNKPHQHSSADFKPVDDYSTVIATLRQQVISYRDSGAIDNDGIENSLLVKLGLADESNNGADKTLQTITFSYDDNGNRINKEYPGPQGPQIQGTDYQYDPENRLVEAWDYQQNK